MVFRARLNLPQTTWSSSAQGVVSTEEQRHRCCIPLRADNGLVWQCTLADLGDDVVALTYVTS